MISFTLVDRRPVFMDERTDDYFLLEHSDETRFLDSLAAGQLLTADMRLREVLNVREQDSIVQVHSTPPSRSLLDGNRERRHSNLLDLLHVARAVRNTKSLLERESILTILGMIACADPKPSNPEDLRNQSLTFAALRKYVPIKPNCLVDSLALLCLLGPARSSAALVFGVKLHPFAAHCWLQAEGVLLNDRIDSVSRFCPIRIVRCSPATL